MPQKNIKRLLVANRSEIAIRVFRTAREMEITPIAIYSHEDRYSLHRFYADEAYQIGKEGEPLKSYLNIEEIVSLALRYNIDAIHPGYGFLSENEFFASKCRSAGIIFIGPSTDTLSKLGNKISAREIAQSAEVPILGGENQSIKSVAEGLVTAEKIGYPVMLKAANGGGGRGMRKVESKGEFEAAFIASQRESLAAFGSQDVFVEKLVRHARHIEVQIVGDEFGNIVHLYERDCSVQRRYQKIVEIAPAPAISKKMRSAICQAACDIARHANYANVGTVEFLVDSESEQFYFIEVNPRIQVEHTVTEEVTGVDIVQAQILIASNFALTDPKLNLIQSQIKTEGFALQCRITTEDPTNHFMPDYGRLTQYRSASGLGVRLDAGSAFSGAVVTPFYDSMLVKVSARGRTFEIAVTRMLRALSEFRVRGIKTNIPFLLRLLNHNTFQRGECTTGFIDNTPHLLDFRMDDSRATKLLRFIGDRIVNPDEDIQSRPVALERKKIGIKSIPYSKPPLGTKNLFDEIGPERFSKWIVDQPNLLITDTTFRDAHQSLFATRMRTIDMLNIAEYYSHYASGLFSLEMWGGATFDVSLRFLKEDPWQRLYELRGKVPNILFQMLLRASSVVGYSNYPDNVVKAFIKESFQAGIDVFRVFDALNWLPNMKVAMEAVRKSGGLCEATICYSGDLSNPENQKYTLDYYLKLAKELQAMGAHILCIKDMAGLCKPDAIAKLTQTLKEHISIPIHFHTHDTAGIQAASIFSGVQAGLDIADGAMAPLSGGTSQPNLNTVVAALPLKKRGNLDLSHLDYIANYWRAVRDYYVPFEVPSLPASSDLYRHEMPGGQYSNLLEQARALGLSDRWLEICEIYAGVNQLFGNIIKVTPTSKAVGDMALFMVANDLSVESVLDNNRALAFPESVCDLMQGMMGQPKDGFPEDVQKRILGAKKSISDRPGDILVDADFSNIKKTLQQIGLQNPKFKDVLSWSLYPKTFENYIKFHEKYGDVSHLPTPVFLYGLHQGEEVTIENNKGNAIIIKYLTSSDSSDDGYRTLFFEVNGQPREVSVLDMSKQNNNQHSQADPNNPLHIGATMAGMISSVAVNVGDSVAKDQAILTVEAMKMESTLFFDRSGIVDSILVKPGSRIDAGELLIVLR